MSLAQGLVDYNTLSEDESSSLEEESSDDEETAQNETPSELEEPSDDGEQFDDLNETPSEDDEQQETSPTVIPPPVHRHGLVTVRRMILLDGQILHAVQYGGTHCSSHRMKRTIRQDWPISAIFRESLTP